MDRWEILSIFISTNLRMYNNDDGNENIEIRVMNEENVKLFKEKLSDVDWPNVFI